MKKGKLIVKKEIEKEKLIGKEVFGVRSVCGCLRWALQESRGTAGAGPGPAQGGKGGEEGTITGVASAAFIQTLIQTLSVRAPLPAPPSRSLQNHFQGKAQGAEDFPPLAPISFLPRARVEALSAFIFSFGPR